MAKMLAHVRTLVLSGFLVGLSGCIGMSKVSDATLPTPPAQAQRHEEELPPDLALQASLAVAKKLEQSKDARPAIEQYEKVLKRDPQNETGIRRLAVLHDRTGEFSRSDVYYEKAARNHPKDADLFNDWGYSHYLRNDWPGAEKHLRKALELNHEHAQARSNLGLVLGMQGKYDEATKLFREERLSEGEIQCNLAFCYCCQGKLEEAKAACRTATRLDPACDKARRLLATLENPPKPKSEETAKESKPKPPEARPTREQLQQEALSIVKGKNGQTPVDLARPQSGVPGQIILE